MPDWRAERGEGELAGGVGGSVFMAFRNAMSWLGGVRHVARHLSGSVFTAFRNAFSSVGGSPLQRNAAGFHGISKRVKLGRGWAVVGRILGGFHAFVKRDPAA